MRYEEFKVKILEELQNFYGDSAEVEITEVQKNNGVRYDGIQIRMDGDSSRIMPVIRVEEFYQRFIGNGMDMEDCVHAVLEKLDNDSVLKGVEQIAEKIRDWEYAKENVFPILLSTEENRELLQKLVSTQMLDLSVAYIIRIQMPDDCAGNAKINKNMLELYGITTEQLHDQAMENLRKDGYEFRSMDSIIRSIAEEDVAEEMQSGTGHDVEMHILTNSGKTYGAAGILDKELLKEFAGEQDYYILPSSIHETIFVPLADGCDQESLDAMVRAVNATQVSVEERLSDHSYYYDAKAGEIRMCA